MPPPFLLVPPFLRGTFAPALRASDKPIAIACLRLLTFLLDLGIEKQDGEIRFLIEKGAAGGELRRIAAYFSFMRTREIQIDAERFEFHAGDEIRLFLSYRHTPALVRALLAPHGLEILHQWVTKSEEEGIFLCFRK